MLKRTNSNISNGYSKNTTVTIMDNGPYASGPENGSDDFVDRLRSDRTSLANQEQGLTNPKEDFVIDQWKAM